MSCKTRRNLFSLAITIFAFANTSQARYLLVEIVDEPKIDDNSPRVLPVNFTTNVPETLPTTTTRTTTSDSPDTETSSVSSTTAVTPLATDYSLCEELLVAVGCEFMRDQCNGNPLLDSNSQECQECSECCGECGGESFTTTTEISTSSQDKCASSPCQNGGTCVDGINSYTCNCKKGYIGSNCETDRDGCASSPCQNGGTCVDGINTHTCNCEKGYTGYNCETENEGTDVITMKKPGVNVRSRGGGVGGNIRK